METVEEVIVEEINMGEEPEFKEGDETEISANYIVLCEEKSFDGFESKIYEQRVCGESLADWVGRACVQKPVFLTLSERENFLDLIKPYAKNNDYTVVLFASTPLVTRAHLKDMLGFAYRKRLNVCRLKKGYILKNEYILNIDEIYASLCYVLDTNDFFEVNGIDDLAFVKQTLTNRMFSFHKKNGVVFENERLTNLDSNVFIGNGTEIAGGVSILSGSYVGEGVTVQEGTIISNSKIGDDTILETGAIIKNSIVKTGAVVETASVVNHSVVGDRARVSLGSLLTSSALKECVTVGEHCYLDNANVLKNANIGKNSCLIGQDCPVTIGENESVAPCSKIIGTKRG